MGHCQLTDSSLDVEFAPADVEIACILEHVCEINQIHFHM